MVVACDVAHFEFNAHLGIKTGNAAGFEVACSVECEAVGALDEGACGHKLAAAAVAVRRTAADLLPRAC